MFGSALRNARGPRTLEEAESLTGYSFRRLSAMELETRRPPRCDERIRRIAEALYVDPLSLLIPAWIDRGALPLPAGTRPEVVELLREIAEAGDITREQMEAIRGVIRAVPPAISLAT